MYAVTKLVIGVMQTELSFTDHSSLAEEIFDQKNVIGLSDPQALFIGFGQTLPANDG